MQRQVVATGGQYPAGKTGADYMIRPWLAAVFLVAMSAFSLAPHPAYAYSDVMEGQFHIQTQYSNDDYKGADAGYVVLSISDDDHGIDVNSLTFDIEQDDDRNLYALEMVVPGWLSSKTSDFKQDGVTGDVVIHAVAPGQYKMSHFIGITAGHCGGPVIQTGLAVPFTVKPGQVTYLGAFLFEPLAWRALFNPCAQGGYFVVSDEQARDMQIASTKHASLPAQVSDQVPDVAALDLPLFQARQLPLQIPSSKAKDALDLLNDSHDLVTKDPDKAKTMLTQAIASGYLWQESLAIAHAWLGSVAAKQKDLNTSKAEFTTAIRYHPEFSGAFGDRAAVRFQQHDYDGAFADLTEAIRLSPRYATWHMLLGDVEMERNHIDLAMVHYDDAIAIWPKYADAYIHRQHADAQLGHYAEAMADIKKGVKAGAIKEGSDDSLSCLYGIALGHGEATLADCDKAVTEYPKDAYVLTARGFVRLELGKTADALDDFNAALKIKDDVPLAVLGRGEVEQKTGDASARKDIDAAYAADPELDKHAKGFGVTALPDASAAPVQAAKSAH